MSIINEVKILVTAQDKTKATFGGVKAGMKAVLTGALALGGGLVIAMSKASEAARESAKITAQTNAVIKSTGGAANISAKGVDDLANALSKKTGIDDEVIKSGENMLLTFTNVRNEAGKGNKIFTDATKVITDMSVALGQDTKTSAIQLGKALNDPIKGIGALKRVGVTFNDEQVKTITHLVKTGKTAEAQKVILEELKKEFGGSAEAQATWADKAKVAAGNVEEAFGKLVNKTFAPIGKWFVEEGAPAIQDFFEGLSKNKDLKRALKELGDAVKGITDEDFQTMLEKVAAALPGIVDGMAEAADSVGEFYDAIVAVNDIVGKEARGGMFDEKGPLGGFTTWIKKTWHDASTSFVRDNGQIIDGVKDMVSRVVGWFGKLPGRVTGAIRSLGNGIQGGWNKMTDWVTTHAKQLVNTVGGWFGRLPSRAAGAIRSLGNKIGEKFTDAYNIAVSKAKALVNRVVDWISRLPGRAKGALSSLASKIGSEVEQAKDTVVRKAKDMVNRAVDFIARLPGRAKGALSSLASKVGSEVEQAKDTVVRKARDMVTRFIDRMQDMVRQARQQAGRVKGAITDRFAGARDWLMTAGRNIIRGLGDGLRIAFNAVKKWVGGIAGWIKAHKGPVSLDRQLLVPAGKALMGGLLEGLKFGFGGVGDFVYKAGSKVSDIIGQIKNSMMAPAKWAGGKLPGGIAAFKALIARKFHVGAGTYPGHGAHGANRAWDFMIHSKAQGNAIAAMGRAVASLVIWNRHIWSRARAREGWRPYTRYGNTSDPSKAHTNHVHVEWYKSGGWINEPIMGIGRSGKRYGFGEAGRELVVPANKVGVGVGGGNTYITVNAPGLVDTQGFRQMLVNMDRRGELQVLKRR